ncbi:MAG TPA: hypothetical protein VMD09_08575 [Solirubrobacteraceae bacterium]|nr:hypothetical protein [Solirubrobacteraceae bacterium]
MRRIQGLADWLTLVGGIGLFVSLFFTWSHQLTPPVLAQYAGSPALQGVPADPTAWQVYSVADVLLALLAGSLVAVALRGRSRGARVTALVAVGLALAFTAHASGVAPTNGVLLIDPSNPSAYLPHDATSGAGETLALVALAVAAAGLLASLGWDLSSKRVRSSR